MIRIQNIYYMLAYAFQVLREQEYARCAAEKFENAADLLAAILARGVSIQVKRGLARAYREETEALRSPRGRIDVSQSVKRQTMRTRRLVCVRDEFSVDFELNRILKATMRLLLRCDLAKERRCALQGLLPYFNAVSELNPGAIRWNLRIDRSNQSYRMLIAVCYLAVKGLLQRQADGSVRLMNFLDEQHMHRLYERFLLEYYRKEHPELHASAAQIPWALDDGFDELLPRMQTDVTLRRGERRLILDAKYYARATQSQFDARTLHSGNLYQIFTYVKNAAAQGGTVSGLLLYAGTDEALQPNQRFRMSGNLICARTLDLNRDFSEIAGELDAIAEEFL